MEQVVLMELAATQEEMESLEHQDLQVNVDLLV